MAAAAMKHMALNFSKLDKFEGVDFRRWQKKMHFLLSSMSVVLNDSDQADLERIASLDEIKQALWERGSSKAPSSDGFSFLFLKNYWDLFKSDVEYVIRQVMCRRCTRSDVASCMQEDIQCAGSDTRPPMLDRTDFESWQQTSTRSSPIARVLNDLSAEEKERYKADIRATNILLQGSQNIFSRHANHYTDAKACGKHEDDSGRDKQRCDSVKSKGEKPFKSTNVRGLKESNFDQLYAYLKQHEVHANENRIMMERFSQPNNDPLALVSDASVQQYPTQSSKSPQSSTEPYPSDNFQMDSGSSSTENLIESLSNSLALLTQSYKSHLPQTNNQLRASSNARNKAMVQDGKVVVQDVRGRYNANNQGRPFQRNNARGNGVAGNVGGQNRGGIINPGQAKPIKCYNLLDEEQSLFLAGEQVTNDDDDVDDSPENDLALNVDHVFEADECDAFDSDVDEGSASYKTIFILTNLTSKI
ncbi:hypothetical protein Tco_1182119 [Tanacetum coccineum]